MCFTFFLLEKMLFLLDMGATPKITPKNGVHGINKENARLFQAKSAQTRAKQAVNRKLAIEAAQNVLSAKVDMSENGSQLGQIMKTTFEQLGVPKEKKVSVLTCAVARSMLFAMKSGDIKSIIEIVKMGGLHFDQTRDALGGKDNPICISQPVVLSGDSEV